MTSFTDELPAGFFYTDTVCANRLRIRCGMTCEIGAFYDPISASKSILYFVICFAPPDMAKIINICARRDIFDQVCVYNIIVNNGSKHCLKYIFFIFIIFKVIFS